MLYIYGLTVHPTLQLESVKAMTMHIKWVASSTHYSHVQLRLPFKASKRTQEGAFNWLEQWAVATAYGCTSTASDYGVGWKSQLRGVDSLGARPRHGISSWSTRVRWARLQSESLGDQIQQQTRMWSSTRHWVTTVQDTWNVSSLGLSPGRQLMGSGQYSCSGDAACRADGPGCRSARTESGISNRCSRRHAVNDGRAGHMKNTVARVQHSLILERGGQRCAGGEPIRSGDHSDWVTQAVVPVTAVCQRYLCSGYALAIQYPYTQGILEALKLEVIQVQDKSLHNTWTWQWRL